MLDEKSTSSVFESSADAIVAGEIALLQRQLHENPELVHARSSREHRATLLHYIAANGVEDYRQRTPSNAVQIASLLLDSGAEVNAEANLYGGGATALGLVATSVHPERAGLQEELMQVLLDYGARMESPDGSGIINSCLANGRKGAAEFLAKRGARVDLEAAAGLGRLDLVQSYFDSDGKLGQEASKAQMLRGFLWACEYGRTAVVDFLLSKELDFHEQAGTGQTCLHWAVIGAHVGIIRRLVESGASLETRNSYGGTALGQAFWSLVNDNDGTKYISVIEVLLESGAKIEEGSLKWLEEQRIDSSAKEHLLELLRSYGADS